MRRPRSASVACRPNDVSPLSTGGEGPYHARMVAGAVVETGDMRGGIVPVREGGGAERVKTSGFCGRGVLRPAEQSRKALLVADAVEDGVHFLEFIPE